VSELPIDPGLLRRLRDAGRAIVWSDERGRRRAAPARIARLRDESARVVLRLADGAATVEVTSGPVGAVVLLLEADRRGLPAALGARNAGADPGFPDGSIVAAWGTTAVPTDGAPRLGDLVDLARYALP